MLLVPKQLRRTGMTGNVPYYGGRFTPAQAYAAAHPSGAVRHQTAGSGSANPAQTLGALQHLLDTGVITAQEYEELRARVVA
ncbi:MAG: hypothetical protein ACRDVN_09675 [Jiangellaceae bacterium]